MAEYDDKRQVAFIWSIEDVQGLEGGEKLTDEQAFEVLQAFEHHHEGSHDAMWDDLKFHLDYWKEEKNG